MAERTTQLRPLLERDIKWISSDLQTYPKVVETYYGRNDLRKQHFSAAGTFRLGTSYSSPDNVALSYMWTPALLEFDPKCTKLTTFKGQLIVEDSQNKVLRSIPPQNIRRVGMEAEMGEVQASGYVLANHWYPLEGLDKKPDRKQFEDILVRAEAGHKKPPGFDPFTRVKVDPALAGRELWIGMLEYELGREIWDRDAVVIDLKTRKMVEREVLRPLARERWENKFS